MRLNKMKTAICFLFTLTAISTVSGQRKIKKLEVQEEGTTNKITFQAINDKATLNGITIKITPITAEEIYPELRNSSLLDGKFSYSTYSKSINEYFLRKKRKTREKTDLEYLFDGLDWLEDSDKINDYEYNVLAKAITQEYVPDFKDPADSERLLKANPYFLSGINLSLFKIEISNDNSTLESVNENILVKSGINTLTNLSSQFLKTAFESSGENSLEKILTLERFNLTFPLLLMPNSSTTKYFATLPFDLASDKLEISVTHFPQVMSWKSTISKSEINSKHSFYEIILYPFTETSSEVSGSPYILVSKRDNEKIYVGDRRIFVDSEILENQFEVFIYGLSYNDLYFGRKTIVPKQLLDFEKSKRSKIEIKIERIPEVKRKVK